MLRVLDLSIPANRLVRQTLKDILVSFVREQDQLHRERFKAWRESPETLKQPYPLKQLSVPLCGQEFVFRWSIHGKSIETPEWEVGFGDLFHDDWVRGWPEFDRESFERDLILLKVRF